MSYIRRDVDQENIPPKTRSWFGTFAFDVVDLGDLAQVILPDFDSNFVWGGCRWQSRDGTTLPNQGDECIVTFDNRNQPWVIAWWPFT